MNDGRGWLHWTLVVLSAGALLLVAVNAWLNESNRSLQADVNRRQEFINQSVEISKIHEILVRSLAQAAVANNNDKLRDLLAQQGITIDTSSSTDRGVVMPPAAAPPAKTGK
jgi:hypothetical protein